MIEVIKPALHMLKMWRLRRKRDGYLRTIELLEWQMKNDRRAKAEIEREIMLLNLEILENESANSKNAML